MSRFLQIVFPMVSVLGMILMVVGCFQAIRKSKTFNYFCSGYAFAIAISFVGGVILGGVGWFYLLLAPVWIFIGCMKFLHARVLCG